jgi:hypothetical protein
MSAPQNASETTLKRKTKYFWITKQTFTTSEEAVTFVKKEELWHIKKRYSTTQGDIKVYSCNRKDCKAALRIFMPNKNDTAEIQVNEIEHLDNHSKKVNKL